jgi:hypothetical protein
VKRARSRAIAFEAIAEVRRVQRLAAEMDVARAASVLRALGFKREAQVETLQADQSAWARSVSSSFNLPLAQVWARAVFDGEGALVGLDHEIRSGEREKEQASDSWRTALARFDAVEALAASAMREARRRRDEDALNDLTDAASQRRAEP